MADTTKYLSYAGLETLVAQIKAYYANATTSDRVAYAGKADKLATARTISLGGDASGSVSFDGSANATLTATIAEASSTVHGLMSATDKAAFDALAKINEVDTTEVADSNGAKLTFSNGKLGLSLPSYALKSDIVAVFKFKGTVADVANLPTSATEGDVYHVTAKHAEYVFVKVDGATSAAWEELGSIMDLSAYAEISKIEDGTIVAGEAQKVSNKLSIKLSDTDTKEFDGSAAISVDLSKIALDDKVAHKLTAAASGMILSGSADGDLASSGVAASKLSNGAVAANNTSFVEGGVVYTAIKDKIEGLDKADTAVAGKYVSAVSETDGVISVERADVASAIATDGVAPVSGKAVSDYVAAEIQKLDKASAAVDKDGKFVFGVAEVDGVIEVTRKSLVSDISAITEATDATVPATANAVKTYVDNRMAEIEAISDTEIKALFA